MGRIKGKILVVDENVDDYDMLEQTFSRNDYRLIWATNGNDGIRIAESEEPDVILLDLHLVDLKGIDVCRNLRLRNSTWSIPIILVSSRPDDEALVVRGLELGANDCVSKPLKKTELMGRVGVLMRMKRVEDKIRRLYLERTRELEWSNIELQRVRTQLILKNQMSTLGMMVAVAAHEIRSPAASISGNLELIGALLQGFLDGLIRIPTLLASASPEDRQSYYRLLREMAQINLEEAPIDMLERRRESKALGARLKEELDTEIDANLLNKLVKFRLGGHIAFIAPMLEKHGPEVLQPFLELGELIVKFKNMNISIERINSIVQAMKAYTHIDRAELQEVNIHEGLEDTLTIMNYIFRGNVEVVKQYATDLPNTQGYPGELNQVWTNLLQNAYDAMEGQKGKIVVRTGVEVIDGSKQIVVRVTDNGKGIPKELLPHIFDSFFTTKEKGQGSGLGLDICKRIVEKHQGTIDVTTIPGETSFAVCLPLERKRIAFNRRNESEVAHLAGTHNTGMR